jgi:hypothetical protein
MAVPTFGDTGITFGDTVVTFGGTGSPPGTGIILLGATYTPTISKDATQVPTISKAASA